MAFNFNLNSVEDYVANHLRLFISLAAGLVVFVGIIALTVFFIAVRGAEQTMVPDVRNKDLTEALLELQVKELYPRIQLRYSQSADERGLILEQDPRAGTIVKAGRRIRLVVSQGVAINTVENYRGRNVEDVRLDLRTLFASMPRPLLSLKEPFMLEYSDEAPGTILQQSPEPGTPIAGPQVLEFVVSRGPRQVQITVPNLLGLPAADALERIGKLGLRFTCSLSAVRGTERPGVIVRQEPAADSPVGLNTRLRLTVSSPEETDNGEIFALFRYSLPENPYPLPVRLEALLPSGEQRTLIELKYLGGEFTVPYELPAGSTLILSMLDRELWREEVRPPLDPLSLDQL
jgi:beta-lactam-binding protein with PASTA domain